MQSKTLLLIFALLPGFLAVSEVSSLPASALPTDQEKALTIVLAVEPAIVIGGNPARAIVTLNAAAPSGGLVITLTSQLPNVAVFEGTSSTTGSVQLTIPEGSTRATVGVRTVGVAEGLGVAFRAAAGASNAAALLTVNPATVTSLAFSQASVVGGNTTTGTIRLNGAAPGPKGSSVQVSARSGAATAPTLVTVAPGATSATFTLTTTPVPSDVTVAVSATLLGGGLGVGTSVTVLAPSVSAVLLSPTSVAGGTGATGTVVLTGAPPAGHNVGVSLSSGSVDATVPPGILIAGSDRGNFTVSTRNVSSLQTVVITARTGGPQGPITDGTTNTITIGDRTSSATASLTINPLVLVSGNRVQSVVAQPSPVLSGSSVSITVSLVQGVRVTSVNVTLSTNRPDLLQLPASVTIPGNSQSSTVSATTTATAADQTVTITATTADAVSTTLLMQALPPIASFTVRPTTVTGGTNLIVQLAPSSVVTRPVEVKLTSDHPELVSLPASVTLSPSTPAAFTFATSQVKEPTSVKITATLGTQTISVAVIVTP